MNYQNVGDVYAQNARIRDKLKKTVGGLSHEQADMRAEEGKWSVAQIVEHMALVDEGMTKICAKLLQKAKSAGMGSDGKVDLPETFLQKSAEVAHMSLEAPEFVRPAGDRTIAESLARMDQNQKIMDEIRPLFESLDGKTHKFPHPFFGEISAHEWLALRGGHEARHIRQIEKILAGFEN
jgi:hypothetical protein